MNTITIRNFKAFRNPITLDARGENVLICGENGAGKSSLYEAIRFAYHREVLYNTLSLDPSIAEENRMAILADFRNKYNNLLSPGVPFSINVDGIDALSFESDREVLHCVSREKIVNKSTITFNDILSAIDVPTERRAAFITDWKEIMLSDVNNRLKNDFHETITISILDDASGRIQIMDSVNNQPKYEKLTEYFNEAKINLVILLLMLSCVFVQIMHETNKKHLLVCDDLVTSLDMTNRYMMLKYILESFKNIQKIVFTHNVSFFNLFQYVNNNIFGNKEKWKYLSMYESEHEHQHYLYEFKSQTVGEIREQIQNGINPIVVGNSIRRRLEQLLVEFSRLYNYNVSLHSTETILTDLINNKPIYAKKIGNSVFYADALVRQIESLVKSAVPDNELKGIIQEKICGFKDVNKDIQPLIPTLKDIHVMKKLLLHPLSHGAHVFPTYSVKEETIALDLIEKLEYVVNAGREQNGGTGNVSEF